MSATVKCAVISWVHIEEGVPCVRYQDTRYLIRLGITSSHLGTSYSPAFASVCRQIGHEYRIFSLLLPGNTSAISSGGRPVHPLRQLCMAVIFSHLIAMPINSVRYVWNARKVEGHGFVFGFHLRLHQISVKVTSRHP